MRYSFGFLCACALGVLPFVGCGDTNVTVYCGTDGAGGSGGSGGAIGDAFPCTEQGIVDAIAEGGGPHTFACVGPTTVTTEAEIVIDNDVILDGEGNLTVDAGGEHADSMDDHRVFSVPEGVTAELHRIAVTGAGFPPPQEGERGIVNLGTLTLSNSLVFGNLGGGILNAGILTIRDVSFSNNGTTRSDGLDGGGIFNNGTLTVTNATISGNSAIGGGGGILNAGEGTASVVNSTISGNRASAEGGGISNEGTLTMTNCTLSGNVSDEQQGSAVAAVASRTIMLSSTLIDGDCQGPLTSNGYNIESPGNTCGFDQQGDQSGVSAVLLDLQPLADNGGPTQTHAITTDSAAFNAGTCEVDEDQRGVTRPQGPACDVGAFERQPEDP